MVAKVCGTNHYIRDKRATCAFIFPEMRRGRRSDAISIYTMTCQVLCWSMPSTDKETETPSGGQEAKLLALVHAGRNR